MNITTPLFRGTDLVFTFSVVLTTLQLLRSIALTSLRCSPLSGATCWIIPKPIAFVKAIAERSNGFLLAQRTKTGVSHRRKDNYSTRRSLVLWLCGGISCSLIFNPLPCGLVIILNATSDVKRFWGRFQGYFATAARQMRHSPTHRLAFRRWPYQRTLAP